MLLCIATNPERDKMMSVVIQWTALLAIIAIGTFTSWMLVHYASDSDLPATKRRRFSIISSAYVLGWLALAIVFALNDAFRAAPLGAFPRTATALGLTLVIGVVLLYRSSTLK